jgi:long-chain acyl-CoA synthetase
VNIYPQEIENVLAMHPGVLDAAALGVPDPEMGEQVKAVVQVNAKAGDQELADRLDAYRREHLAGFKCPRSFEFTTWNCGPRWARSAAGRCASNSARPRVLFARHIGHNAVDPVPRAARIPMKVALYLIESLRCHIH